MIESCLACASGFFAQVWPGPRLGFDPQFTDCRPVTAGAVLCSPRQALAHSCHVAKGPVVNHTARQGYCQGSEIYLCNIYLPIIPPVSEGDQGC